jgi:hypothetical protein
LYCARRTFPDQLIGGAGAVWGALFPSFAALLVVAPLMCAADRCGSVSGSVFGKDVNHSGSPMLWISLNWSAYIENAEGLEPSGRDGKCRPEGALPPPRVRLTHFVFPPSIAPTSFLTNKLFACVLTRSDGTILSARLPQEIQGGVADRELVDWIEQDWRFEGTHGGRSGWQRIRLSVESSVVPPAPRID